MAAAGRGGLATRPTHLAPITIEQPRLSPRLSPRLAPLLPLPPLQHHAEAGSPSSSTTTSTNPFAAGPGVQQQQQSLPLQSASSSTPTAENVQKRDAIARHASTDEWEPRQLGVDRGDSDGTLVPIKTDDYPRQARVAGALDVWALGIVIVIGGQFFSWNPGLSIGFGSYLLATCLMGLAYMVLISSMAEMAGALPFSGGAFGFSRATHGTYIGFLVGCCESVEYILYVSSSVIFLGEIITHSFGLPEPLEPLWWLVFYVIAIAIHVHTSARLFWRINLFTAVFLVALVAAYCLIIIPIANFSSHAALPAADGQQQPGSSSASSSSAWFRGGVSAFVNALPLTTWWYVGVEALPMACDATLAPRHSIPVGMMFCVTTLMVTAVAVLFCTIAAGPSITEVATALLPFSYGLAEGLHLPPHAIHVVDLASLLATATTAFGFIFAYGRQVCAMSRSGLLPPLLSRVHPTTRAPQVAIYMGSAVGAVAALVLWAFLDDPATVMFEICITFGLVTYICQLLSYVKLRVECRSLARTYVSPFGTLGALLAAVFFAMTLVGEAKVLLLHLPPSRYDDEVGTVGLSASVASRLFTVLYVLASTAYYVVRARKQQRFSREEMTSMVAVYTQKAIRRAERETAQRLQANPHDLTGTINSSSSSGGEKRSSSRKLLSLGSEELGEEVEPQHQGGWSLNDAGMRFVGELKPPPPLAGEAGEEHHHGLVVVDDTSFFERALRVCKKLYEEATRGGEAEFMEEAKGPGMGGIAHLLRQEQQHRLQGGQHAILWGTPNACEEGQAAQQQPKVKRKKKHHHHHHYHQQQQGAEDPNNTNNEDRHMTRSSTDNNNHNSNNNNSTDGDLPPPSSPKPRRRRSGLEFPGADDGSDSNSSQTPSASSSSPVITGKIALRSMGNMEGPPPSLP